MTLLKPSELRARAAQVLAPVSDQDPPVIDAPPDAVHPPCYILEWNDPWLEFQTPSLWFSQLAIVCVTGRLDPQSGTETLEQMAADVVGRFKADSYSWPQTGSSAPRMLEINGVSLLAARIVYRAPVTLNGGG
jgi:hypothetical protein